VKGKLGRKTTLGRCPLWVNRVAAEFDKAPAGADTADASVVLQMVLMLENVERG
jgi:hypothetical protein